MPSIDYLTNCSQLTQVLNQLVEVLGKESDRRVVDNVAAAACRLIMTGEASVPVDQVMKS